jgi:hypothetical protein
VQAPPAWHHEHEPSGASSEMTGRDLFVKNGSLS